MKRAPSKSLFLEEIAEGRFEGKEFVSKSGLKAFRARVWGNAVDSYESEQKEFASILLDDFTAELPVNAWGQEEEMLKKIKIGDRVEAIGRIREGRNGEIFLAAEIVKKIDASTELLRRAENAKTLKQFKRTGKEEEIEVEEHII